MARAKFQVLILPFSLKDNEIKYCIFHRSDMNIWQFIAGGGEDNETPLEAAIREAYEEAELSKANNYYPLDTFCSISTECFSSKDRSKWGEDCLVVPEYSFAVEVQEKSLSISHEHTKYNWVGYETAKELLRYDSNKVALWELDNRIKNNKLKEATKQAETG